MTFREKLAQERPDGIGSNLYEGGCCGCPNDYGYEGHDDGLCRGTWVGGEAICRACWDREIPMTPEEQERHDLEINAEIIRGYCDQYKTKPCIQCPAHDPCYEMLGNAFAASANKYNPEKQRSMLDAFEAALPPEEEEVPTVRLPETVTVKIGPEDEERGIPKEVRRLVEARIRRLTEEILSLEAERAVLRYFLKEEMEK